MFHCVYVPQLSYPFICQWTSRLIPCPGYCKQCCDEHWGNMGLFQFWFPRCVCPVVGLLGHKALLFPVFKALSTLFSIVAVLVCIPTNRERGFPFLQPSPAFTRCRLLDSSHSDWCEMAPHCGFDLYFSDNVWCWASFHVFVSDLYVFFGEMSV